jgi:SIR2-like domain
MGPQRNDRFGGEVAALWHTAGMTISRANLVETYGRAILSGNAAVFIGAGLSLAAGYPDWSALLAPIQKRCKIPYHPDLPLVAEYITHDLANGGRPALESHILTTFAAVTPTPTPSHQHLRSLAINEIWTTNYDPVIEAAIPEAVVVASDKTIHNIASRRRAIIKMHGSIAPSGTWEQPPVITRSDYELYESRHPRTWTVLRSSYMSRTMLFLGFSFSDPNIEILLRLARTLGTATGDRHVAVLKAPSGGTADELLQHALRINDLEKSGITVCEIDGHDEIPEILAELVLRTRPEHLFIAGSAGIPGATTTDEDAVLGPWCAALANTMVDEPGWTISSLGGRASWLTTRDVAVTRRKEGNYDPSKLLIHFRGKDEPPVVPDDRVGTSIYSDLTREQLVPSVLDDCRALIAICGGTRTTEEIEWALNRNVAVIPLAASGGAAHAYWETNKAAPPNIGSRATDPATWALLGDTDPTICARAAKKLLDQAMYK